MKWVERVPGHTWDDELEDWQERTERDPKRHYWEE